MPFLGITKGDIDRMRRRYRQAKKTYRQAEKTYRKQKPKLLKAGRTTYTGGKVVVKKVRKQKGRLYPWNQRRKLKKRYGIETY